MAILVTGGAGFIGSNLLRGLAGRGAELVCLDNFDDFYPPDRKRRNIGPLVSSGKVKLYEGDIRDTALCLSILKDHAIDTVYHLAARPGPRPSIQLPQLYQDINCGGTVSLLEAAVNAGVGKFIFVSSSSVYAASTPVPFREDSPADEPFSPYGATKRACELFCHAYHHVHGLPVICARLFSVYGPGLRPDLALYKFTGLMIDGKPIPIFGDGTSGRDYTYISDIIDGLIACLDANVGFEIVNLGNSHTVGLLELVGIIAKALGVEPTIEHMPPNPADPPVTCADLSKSSRLLGFRPKVSIEEGIERFIEWFKSEASS